MQDRLGPNRAGPRGILQPVADGIKNILKEEMIPGGSNKVLFVLAPAMLALFPAIVLPMVIPWAAPLPVHFDFTLPLIGRFLFDGLDQPPRSPTCRSASSSSSPSARSASTASRSAGWASNNKYSLLGGLRADAQMISYEIAMGLSPGADPPPDRQRLPSPKSCPRSSRARFGWFIFPLALSAFVFLVSSLAETNRVPFDLPEAESELVAGYHSEYSAMKFSAFFIAEYANMLTASMMFAPSSWAAGTSPSPPGMSRAGCCRLW